MTEHQFSGEVEVKEIYDYLEDLHYKGEKYEIDFEIIKSLLWFLCSDNSYVEILDKSLVKITTIDERYEKGQSRNRQRYFIAGKDEKFKPMLESTFLNHFGSWAPALLIKLLHIRATCPKRESLRSAYYVCTRILDNPHSIAFLNTRITIPSAMIIEVKIIKELILKSFSESEKHNFKFFHLLTEISNPMDTDLFHPSSYKYKVPNDFDYKRYL